MFIKSNNIKIYIALLVSMLTFALQAQEDILKASVSKNKLGVNQRFRVQYTISKQGGDNFKAPNFKNFKIIGGPSQSVSQSWINGKMSFSQSYTYILQPKRKGELTIPPATIEIEGNTVKSNTVKIIVLDAVDLPKDPNDPSYIASQNIHLVAEVSKSRPYVGEGIYVEYRLYFSNNIGIYNYSVVDPPQYNGFWNQEIESKEVTVKKGTYNGEKYRYAILHKALLIPTKSGKLTIDPMKMDIVVNVPTGRADFFGNPISRKVPKEFSSPRKVIRAKELPLDNKPADFNGAVGEFSFDVSLSKQILKANESSQIKIGVKGKGNLKLFELPKVETPKELEVYQPERKEKVSISSSGLRGTIVDNYTVVPEFRGKYKIPAISFSYFNPKEGVYQTITSEDLYVDVIEGKELVTNSDSNQVIKKNITITGENFRFIQTNTLLENYHRSDFYGSLLFYVLLLLPFASIPLVIVLYKKKEKRNRDVLGNKQRLADRLAKKYLSEASKQLGNKESFYEALERALYNFLKAKLKVETSDISREKITSLLTDKKVATKDVNDFVEVLNQCDFARYTPTTNVQMKQEFEKAKQVITQLDKQL